MPSFNKHRKKLEELPVENNFSTPEGYFEDFDLRMKERLQAEKNSGVNKGKSWRFVKPQLMLAASIIAFAVISYFAIHFITGRNIIKGEEYNIAIYEYIENNIYDTDETELLKIYSSATELSDEEETDEYSDVMIEYLLMEDIDIELIYNEL